MWQKGQFVHDLHCFHDGLVPVWLLPSNFGVGCLLVGLGVRCRSSHLPFPCLCSSCSNALVVPLKRRAYGLPDPCVHARAGRANQVDDSCLLPDQRKLRLERKKQINLSNHARKIRHRTAARNGAAHSGEEERRGEREAERGEEKL